MIQIVICDDNELFLEQLRFQLRRIMNVNNMDAAIYVFTDAESIPEHRWSASDIFILDVDFSDKPYTGVDIARKARFLNPGAIILFVTNYLEYAPEGYEVQAFRYLLKDSIAEKLDSYLLETIQKLQSHRQTIDVTVDSEVVALPLENILYIEAQKHTVLIHVLTEESGAIKIHRVYAGISSMEEKLADQGFLRLQKSYIVNMRHIKRFRCAEVVLDNGISLPASEKFYAANKKQYLLWKGRQ